MPNRAELETQLATEIHRLPIEAIEAMLKLAMLMKKTSQTETSPQTDNFVDFIRRSPLMDIELDLTRDQALCRDIDL